jgi:hypothetical protein
MDKSDIKILQESKEQIKNARDRIKNLLCGEEYYDSFYEDMSSKIREIEDEIDEFLMRE